MDKKIVDPGSTGKIADYFKPGNKNFSYLTSSTTASLAGEIESSEFLQAYGAQEDRFVPQIDFASASNFARYGSAEEYYKDAFTRIYNQYPYDGSQKEKVLWELSSSYLDKHIFENEYPRTTGHATIGAYQTALTGSPAHSLFRSYDSSTKEYIFIKGGPNADPNGDWKSEIEPGQSIKGLSKANIYDTGSFRESNLKLDLSYGNTVEFWLKKAQWANDDAEITGSIGGTSETIFDLWNSASLSDVGLGGTYGRFTVYLRSSEPNKIFAGMQSGSNNAQYCPSDDSVWCAGGFDTGLTNIADDKWHHYALVSQNSGNVNKSQLYVDGVLTSTKTSGSADHWGAQGPVTGAFIATIGSQVTTILNDNKGGLGWGKLSGSIDEFRFWKTARNARQIGRFYKDQVHGGANTDLSNTYLGVYYKFNEGITQTSSVDSVVLDYSGRISDGLWEGYSSTDSRSTSSALVDSGHASREFQDPIIYSFHPDVASKLESLKTIGQEHDFNNGTSLINSLPSWISEDDYARGEGQLHKLTQILASYLDTLHLQIEALPTIKNIQYASSSARPHFFNDRLLKDYGFNVDEILTDIDLFAYANTRDNKKLFEKKLYDVKNQIYKNIYNNLVHIYKTKGTKKSFRNVLRCVGIDEELVRLNLYGQNTNWRLQTNTRDVSSKSKYVDFYNNNAASVYGYPEVGNSNSKSYIFGSGDETNGIDSLSAVTIETQILFPKYPLLGSEYSKIYSETTSSLFGLHTAKTDSDTDTAWATSDSGSVQVYIVRKQKQSMRDSPEAYFLLTGSALGPITSSVYADIYDNTEWNLSVRFKDTKYPQVDFVSGSDTPVEVTAELIGYQHLGDTIINSFAISGTLQSVYGSTFFSVPKRLFVGAHRTNFSGTLLNESDVYVSYARYWNSYLENDVLEYHAKNDASYGLSHPHRNTYVFQGKDSTSGLGKTEMPKISSLALNWDFAQVTASDASGQFIVSDFSSGSNELSNYPLSSIVERQHTGLGDNFAASSTQVVEKKYVPSTRLIAPDLINSDDMVNIVDFEGEIFTREHRPVKYFYAFEKSMYANISDEMLNMFAGIKDFHNLIGDPVTRYRKSSKEMDKIKELFFRRVDNIPDLDKFIEYFKWIDNSISTMLLNLVPATADMADNVRNMVESHVLERNRIETKYTNLNLQQPEPDGRIKGINELLYNWKEGREPGNFGYAWMQAVVITNTSSDLDGEYFTLISTDGTKRKYVFDDNGAGATGTVKTGTGNSTEVWVQIQGMSSQADFRDEIIEAVNSSAGHQGKILAMIGSTANTFRFNQLEPGPRGNTAIDTDVYVLHITFSHFLYGTAEENTNCLYWKDRAERDRILISSGDSIVDEQREIIKRISNSVVSGSTYALRKFTRPYHFAVDRAQDFKIDNIKYNFVKTELDQSSKTENIILQDVESFVDCTDKNDLNVKRRLDFKANLEQSPIKGRNIAPFTVYSSSVDTGYKTALTTFNSEIEINDNHRDVYGAETQETLQGPFTKIHVGGKKSRKVAPFTTTDRIEEYDLAVNASNLTLSKRADDDPKSKYFLDEIAKRPVVIKNIKTSTGSLYLGNYSKEYQIVQTVGANTQKGWLKDNFANFTQATAEVFNLSGNIDFNMMDRTGSSLQSVTIADRFSAPGSPEAMALGYLDPASHTFSVYNSLNYRNMTVRKPRSYITASGVNAVAVVSITSQGLGGWAKPFTIGLTSSAGLNITFKENYLATWLTDPTVGYDDNGLVFNYGTRCSAFWDASDCAAIGPGLAESGSAHSLAHAINTAFSGGALGITASAVITNYPGATDPAQARFWIYQTEPGIAGNGRAVMEERSSQGATLETFRSGTNPSVFYETRPFGNPHDINLRTLTTTPPLDILQRNHMAGGPYPGYDARLSTTDGVALTASIHKVNRNVGQSAEAYIMPDGTEIAVNRQRYDNFFIQHAIPQSDRQYAWITASLSGNYAGPNIFGNLYYAGGGDGLTAPLGYSIKSNDMTFISSSDLGSYEVAGGSIPGTRFYGPDAALGTKDFYPNNFVGLNTHIYDPVTASTNHLGHLVAYTIGGPDNTDWTYKGGLQPTIYNDSYKGLRLSTTYKGRPRVLNGLIHHRQGPYGWPSWKQIRGGNHPIMRHHRKTNTFSAVRMKVKELSIPNTNDKKELKDGANPILNFTESVVTIKHKPVQIKARAVQDLYKPTETQDMTFNYTFNNNICSFADPSAAYHAFLFNRSEWFKSTTKPPPIYDSITSLYRDDDIVSPLNPIKRFESLRYTEVIWPRSKNTFLNRTRARNNYTEIAGGGDNSYDRISHRSFWRDSIEDRVRTDLIALNNQNYYLSASNTDSYSRTSTGDYLTDSGSMAAPLSIWPLEGAWTGSVQAFSAAYGPATSIFAAPAINALNFRDKYGGQLFNGPSYIKNYDSAGSWGSRDLVWTTASVRYHGVDGAMRAIAPGTTLDASGYVGGAAMVAGNLWRIDFTGSSNINWTTNIDRGRNPWYDSYADYSADLSKIGKDYSIIPEFNISEHMPYYIIDKDSDFMSPIPQRNNFRIDGIINSASINKQFYNDYSYSDFLKNFDIIVEDHKKLANVTSIRLTCHGLKKLLPYNGFYPVNRTIQMATLLSQSLGDHISGTQEVQGNLGHVINPQAARTQALLQPYFAPGILYNTIKSGIAVDWPTYTGSIPDPTAASKAYTYATASNYRLPFEALYDFSKLPVYDPEEANNRRNKLYAVANDYTSTFFVWDGKESHDLYRRAMDNFLAESVNLFIKNGRLTSWTSKPMSEVSFKQDVTYQMSIDIEMIDNIMTEGAINSSIAYGNGLNFGAGGPGTTASFYYRNCRGEIYGAAADFITASTLEDIMKFGERQDPAYAPYTPPYFYGKATVDLTYTNTVEDTPQPSLGTIFSKITASYYNNLSNIPSASYDTGSREPTLNMPNPAGAGMPLRTWVDRTSPAISTMMNVSSSLDLFGKKIAPLVASGPDGIIVQQPDDPTEQEQWVISTKYECPVLSFNHYTDDSKARGMWNGYGNIPEGGRGLRLTLRDTEPSELGAYTSNSKSLLAAMFAQGTPKNQKVGELPTDGEKSISECIVAIPYLQSTQGGKTLATKFNCIFSKADNKYFFPIYNIEVESDAANYDATNILDVIDQVQEQVNETSQAPSVLNLKDKMRRFIFPPRWDFVNNSNPIVDPFVMFAFEFKHKFSRQELQDIWQGVMPDIAMKVVPDSSTLSIPCKDGELMSEFWRKLVNEEMSKSDIKKTTRNLRWMVFKVKQRARNKYINVTETESDNLAFITNQVENTADIDHTYSYNWPYDYCSLVELAKLETSIKLTSPEVIEETPEPAPEDSFFEEQGSQNPELPEGQYAYTPAPPQEEGTDF